MTPVAAVTNDFSAFAAVAEPKLKLALGAAFGFDLAEEATAEALAFAWENWDKVAAADNPIGYVFAVGRNKLRRSLKRRQPYLPPAQSAELPWIEPGLPKALSTLSERQREVIMLLHCFEWTLAEVADLLGMSKGSVQVHDRRGMARLRRDLGCSDG